MYAAVLTNFKCVSVPKGMTPVKGVGSSPCSFRGPASARLLLWSVLSHSHLLQVVTLVSAWCIPVYGQLELAPS